MKVSTTDEVVVCSRRRYRIYVFITHRLTHNAGSGTEKD
jgi:hypothetical protein